MTRKKQNIEEEVKQEEVKQEEVKQEEVKQEEVKQEQKENKFLLFVKAGEYTIYDKNNRAFILKGSDKIRYYLTEIQVREFLNNSRNNNVFQSNSITIIDLQQIKPLID
jgi:hypothetical protein